MSSQTADWIAVGVAVVFAVAWLGFHFRRSWRKKKELKGKIGACCSPCEGCTHAKGCGGIARD